jgi:hypothetical protein
MRTLSLGSLLILLIAAQARPMVMNDPDDDGYIRNWLILAPIPLGDGVDGAAGLGKVGLPDEGKISPKAEDKVTIAGKEFTWRKYQAKESHVDFNDFLGGQTEDCVAYAVCTINCAEEVKNVTLKVGSDDQSKVYLNGKEVYKYEGARALEKDQDSVTGLTLNKGKNIIVFKVVNEKIDFSCSLRFLDGTDKPVKNFKVEN